VNIDELEIPLITKQGVFRFESPIVFLKLLLAVALDRRPA